MNKVVFGVNSLDVNVEGKTVRDVAAQSAGLLNMNSNEVTPKINGREVSWDTVVPTGAEVRFERPMGGKGC